MSDEMTIPALIDFLKRYCKKPQSPFICQQITTMLEFLEHSPLSEDIWLEIKKTFNGDVPIPDTDATKYCALSVIIIDCLLSSDATVGSGSAADDVMHALLSNRSMRQRALTMPKNHLPLLRILYRLLQENECKEPALFEDVTEQIELAAKSSANKVVTDWMLKCKLLVHKRRCCRNDGRSGEFSIREFYHVALHEPGDIYLFMKDLSDFIFSDHSRLRPCLIILAQELHSFFRDEKALLNNKKPRFFSNLFDLLDRMVAGENPQQLSLVNDFLQYKIADDDINLLAQLLSVADPMVVYCGWRFIDRLYRKRLLPLDEARCLLSDLSTKEFSARQEFMLQNNQSLNYTKDLVQSIQTFNGELHGRCVHRLKEELAMIRSRRFCLFRDFDLYRYCPDIRLVDYTRSLLAEHSLLFSDITEFDYLKKLIEKHYTRKNFYQLAQIRLQLLEMFFSAFSNDFISDKQLSSLIDLLDGSETFSFDVIDEALHYTKVCGHQPNLVRAVLDRLPSHQPVFSPEQHNTIAELYRYKLAVTDKAEQHLSLANPSMAQPRLLRNSGQQPAPVPANPPAEFDAHNQL